MQPEEHSSQIDKRIRQTARKNNSSNVGDCSIRYGALNRRFILSKYSNKSWFARSMIARFRRHLVCRFFLQFFIHLISRFKTTKNHMKRCGAKHEEWVIQNKCLSWLSVRRTPLSRSLLESSTVRCHMNFNRLSLNYIRTHFLYGVLCFLSSRNCCYERFSEKWANEPLTMGNWLFASLNNNEFTCACASVWAQRVFAEIEYILYGRYVFIFHQ